MCRYVQPHTCIVSGMFLGHPKLCIVSELRMGLGLGLRKGLRLGLSMGSWAYKYKYKIQIQRSKILRFI